MSPQPLSCRLLPVLLLSSVAAGLLLPVRGAAPVGKKYALLVGIKEYEDRDLPDLKFTENDVEDLAALLRRKSAGFASVRVLTTSRGRKRGADRPTLKNIRAALQALLSKTTKHDTVLLALAGHGVQLTVKDRAEAFFCPADGKGTRAATLLGLAELFRELRDSKAGVQLLLVDACRNDPATGRSMDVDTVPRPPRGTAALFSCSSGQRAFETDKLKHGVFFHFVLEGLRGKARGEDGEVSWDHLALYVKRQVSRQTPELVGGGARQTPHEVRDLRGESPVLLAATARGAEVKKAPAGVKVPPTGGSHGTSIDFVATPTEAAKRAQKEGKLVFVLHVSGHFEDPRFTCDNAEALRVGALANPAVGKYLNESFVSSFQKVATFKIVGGAKQGGNVASYFCAPDGRVLHVVAGPVNAATMLREAKWVVETAERAIKESKGDGGKFKALFRKAHAERLKKEHGLVVKPVLFDTPGSALTYRDPTGRPLAPKLPPPPLEGPDVALRPAAFKAKQAEAASALGARGLVDRRGRRWVLGNQGRVHMLLAAHAMVKIEKIYGAVFEGILNEKISTRPVEIVTPFPWVRPAGALKRGG
jgi:hypothetical protein